MATYLFYRRDTATPGGCDIPLPEGYRAEIWRPARDGVPRHGLPMWPFAVWWLFDKAGLFATRDAGVLAILKDGRLVHRSLVTPRWHRFPDMGARDLQIGDTWTDPDHRGRGLAKAAIGAIEHAWRGRYARMWYLVDAGNLPSIRAIEGCGYRLAGTGVRTRPLGLSPIGRFVISDRGEADAAG